MIIARRCTAAQLAAGYREARSMYRIERDNASGTYRVFAVDLPDMFARAASLRAARRIVSCWIREDTIRFRALDLAQRSAVRLYARAVKMHGAFPSVYARKVRPVAFGVLCATEFFLRDAAENSSFYPSMKFLSTVVSFSKGGAK